MDLLKSVIFISKSFIQERSSLSVYRQLAFNELDMGGNRHEKIGYRKAVYWKGPMYSLKKIIYLRMLRIGSENHPFFFLMGAFGVCPYL